MSEKKLPLEVSPAGVAGFAKYLYEKDTKFSRGDESKAKYSLKLLVPKDKLATRFGHIKNGSEPIPSEEWLAHIQKMHEQAGGKAGEGPVRDGDKIRKKDGDPVEAWQGHYVVTFKTAHPPQLVDTKKRDLPDDVRIFGGDVVKVAYRPSVYEGFGGGITLYLNAVMLIDKRSSGSATALAALGDNEEGYVAERSEKDSFGGKEGVADNGGDY
ncbi:MAG: DUF2815 family protein [Actinobacteria bacterium]|nr:DUF2815 family protein [Actinomycetota bacterium]